ncbi:hypothetical protein GGI22_004639, partial [Coemansia erecta]
RAALLPHHAYQQKHDYARGHHLALQLRRGPQAERAANLQCQQPVLEWLVYEKLGHCALQPQWTDQCQLARSCGSRRNRGNGAAAEL